MAEPTRVPEQPNPAFSSTLPPPQRFELRHNPAAAEIREPASDELPRRRRAPKEPELPEIHRADVLCVGPIMANLLYAYLGRPITFWLLDTNLPLLLLIRSSVLALIRAGALVSRGLLPLWLPLTFSLPYLLVDDPFYYWAGRRYGDRLTSYLIEQDPRWEVRIAKGERLMERFGFWAIIISGVPFVPVPVSVLFFIAGDSRMPIWKFALACVISAEMFVASMVGLGFVLGDAANGVVDQISKYSGYLALASIGLIVVSMVVSVRRSLRRMRELEELRQREDNADD